MGTVVNAGALRGAEKPPAVNLSMNMPVCKCQLCTVQLYCSISVLNLS